MIGTLPSGFSVSLSGVTGFIQITNTNVTTNSTNREINRSTFPILTVTNAVGLATNNNIVNQAGFSPSTTGLMYNSHYTLAGNGACTLNSRNATSTVIQINASYNANAKLGANANYCTTLTNSSFAGGSGFILQYAYIVFTNPI